ncbi:hypothetical protein BDW22DRAFT_1322895 [Trametopsis cervina]|nr:hypothetical protein BDW22DRAFT_1322895 [Trametopsis cervina]
MSSSDAQRDDVLDSAKDAGEKEKDRDRSGKTKSASAKTKDLSHVPCKFFKVGSCTAGSSCPFSHSILEPGQQKEVCAWFVKGNCKFGHKCALAHILPGQSMSMDRKNKKAAQAAASASNSTSASKEGRAGRSQRTTVQGQQGSGINPRNPLLSGSTAPTRSHSSSRPPIPMPLKATLSPSAPAPPIHTTDFASYGLPDESNKLPSAPAQGRSSTLLNDSQTFTLQQQALKIADQENTSVPLPLPVSNYVAPPRSGLSQSRAVTDTVDFGPIGSPPRASPATRPLSIKDLSPGSSPHVTMVSSSPFSVPGTQSTFSLTEQKTQSDFRARSGLSASLGALMSWSPDFRQDAIQEPPAHPQEEVAVEEGDLEEFIPGSLSELLTPEEKSRRFSRNNVSRPLQPIERDGPMNQPSGESHHRHSRSVPAPSLLQEIRSIWTEHSMPVPDIGTTGVSVTGGGLGNGTPSSFQSGSGFGSRNEDVIHPSNASAAFLPGLHHYINAKSNQRSTMTASVSSLYAQQPAISSSHHPSTGLKALNGLAHSPSRQSAFATGIAYDSGPEHYLGQQHQYSGARPVVSEHDTDDRRNASSPSTRALQAHAPGQSLPQGLAAGYSRIHALPPPPSIPSPSTSAAFSPGRSPGFAPSFKGSGHVLTGSVDWHGSSPPSHLVADSTAANASVPGMNGSLVGLDAVFSRLSHSAAASRPVAAANTRSTSSRTWQNTQGPFSPLSGPVLTGDDDDLFSMDG